MSELLNYLSWPFQFPFMQNAFIIGVLVATPAALLSCYLVLKGWSLMGDAVSHAVLPGVVIAYIVGLPLSVGAFAAGMVCAIGTGYLKDNSRIKEDTVMGVVFAGMFGLGIVLYTSITTDVHLDHILFGNMLGASWADIAETGLIAVLVSGIIAFCWRDLMLFVFDQQQASAIGLPVRVLHYGLLAILSLTIVGALKAVGIILVISLLVAPGSIAFLIARRLGTMLVVAVAVSVSATIAGVYMSFWLDSAPAPTIVLLMTATFIVVFAWTSIRNRRRVAAI